ncbi:hypothetical protein BFN03_08585 [Rhodococcus sp. WMMA185]|nr:hypothetical protein BFN03_08585 [Rhodococcus sp. WMMA185]
MVAVIVLGVIFWFQLRDRIADQGTAAADACVEGDSVLAIAADPDIAPQIQTLADRFSATRPVIRDHCVTVTVTSVASDTVRDALSAGADAPWNTDVLGPRPALWIPSSSHSVNQIPVEGVINGDARPLAISPVVLAVGPSVEGALTAASVDWRDLPSLQTGRDSVPPLGMALPEGPGAESTEMAVESIAASVAGSPAGPVTEEQASSDPVTSALSELALGYEVVPGAKPATTRDALTALATRGDPTTAGIHAVAATEQQVYQTLRETPGTDLTAYVPTGPTPVADHPAAILSGQSVDETQSRAAAQFADFARQPEQAQVLADAGFRIDGLDHPGDTTLTFPSLGPALVPADAAAATDLMQAIQNPITERASTILLDASSSMGDLDGSATRLENTTAALAARLDQSPDTLNLGLWEYSTNLNDSRPYNILVATGPVSGGGYIEGTRRQALDNRLTKVEPAAGSATYASLEAAYKNAVDQYAPDRINSVLLITDSGNDDDSVTSADLLATITETFTPSAPVRVDIVTIGQIPDLDTLQAVADRTGGTLEQVDSTDGTALPAAIDKLLS